MSPKRHHPQSVIEQAIARIEAGEDVATVAASLGVNPRTARSWHRRAHPERAPKPSSKPSAASPEAAEARLAKAAEAIDAALDAGDTLGAQRLATVYGVALDKVLAVRRSALVDREVEGDIEAARSELETLVDGMASSKARRTVRAVLDALGVEVDAERVEELVSEHLGAPDPDRAAWASPPRSPTPQPPPPVEVVVPALPAVVVLPDADADADAGEVIDAEPEQPEPAALPEPPRRRALPPARGAGAFPAGSVQRRIGGLR